MKVHYLFVQILVLKHLVTALRRVEVTRRGPSECVDLDNLPLLGEEEAESQSCSSSRECDLLDNGAPPAQGSVWPTLNYETREEKFYEMTPKVKMEFSNVIDQDVLMFLDHIEKNFRSKLRKLCSYSNKCNSSRNARTQNWGRNRNEVIENIMVNMNDSSQTIPQFEMMENFGIQIRDVIKITALQVWGVIRALDTLLQLCYINEDGVLVIHKNDVQDAPKYQHRGLMIDTETHYISVNNIMKMIDAMAMNKFNVLHWRIIGDTSFPYNSIAFPELSEKGAFYKACVYKSADIKNIIDFASIRGIRVIPEFNMPGHVASMAMSHPEIITTCSSNPNSIDPESKRCSNRQDTDLKTFGPMNPTNQTFELLRKLLNEVQRLFPDNHFHLGGENVDRDCWLKFKNVGKGRLRTILGNSGNLVQTGPRLLVKDVKRKLVFQYGKVKVAVTEARLKREVYRSNKWKQRLSAVDPTSSKETQKIYLDLHVHFVKKLLYQNILRPNKIPIIAQEVLSLKLASLIFPKHTKSQAYCEKVFNKMKTCHHYDTILSWPFDISRLENMSLVYFYEKAFPHLDHRCNFIGGEALIYSYDVDDFNIFTRAFPAACMIADVLWHGIDEDNTHRDKTTLANNYRKVQEQTCRMARLGIPVGPIGPDHCEVEETVKYGYQDY